MITEAPSPATAARPPVLARIAQGYVEAGISVIPLNLDGSKSPAVASWQPYRSEFATDDELLAWFRRPAGIGFVCGVLSGGLEVLDFDERPDETFAAWFEQLPPAIRTRLCVCETGGLGFHVIYRCEEVCGNTKIAMTSEGGVLIESRGEGGYIVAAGSPVEVHVSGSPYVQVRGEPLPAIPTLTTDERKTLWQVAASFDERPNRMAEYIAKRAKEIRPLSDYLPTGDTPWDDFDSRATWDEVLLPAGWTTRDGIHWTRPNPKREGATSGKVCIARSGVEVLTVYSSNAGPLAPQGGSYKTWGKFGAFAALHHNGDRREAARAARAAGYGRASR